MSIKNLSKHVSDEAARLVSRLADELRQPAPGEAQPLILLEGGDAEHPQHIYVIWDEWRDISGIERSEVIMEAFEHAKGKDRCLDVTLAMGLTSAEAKRLNIG